MNTNPLSRPLSVFLAFSLIFGSYLEPAAAQRGRFPTRFPHGNVGRPRAQTTVGGGIRGVNVTANTFCGQPLQDANLTPLVPAKDSITYTTNPDPLILVYVPPLPSTSSGKGHLTVTDHGGATLGDINLDIPLKGGLVAFSMPPDILPLKDKTLYEWTLQIPCNQRISMGDPSVMGYLGYQAVPPDPASEEKDTNFYLKKIDDLAEAGYWLDAIMETASLLNVVAPEVRDSELVPRLHTLLQQEQLDQMAHYFLN